MTFASVLGILSGVRTTGALRKLFPVSNVALVVAMLAVAGVLLLGLINMARGGSPETSQKLMRWRVWLQFIAVAIAMLVLFMSSR